jgi:hypothetical protein
MVSSPNSVCDDVDFGIIHIRMSEKKLTYILVLLLFGSICYVDEISLFDNMCERNWDCADKSNEGILRFICSKNRSDDLPIACKS